MRNQTVEEKAQKLLQNSFPSMENDLGLYPQMLDEIGEELVSLMQYFGDREVYVVDLPILLVPHPEPGRRRIDPDLRGTPSEHTLSMDAIAFNTVYDLTERINEELDSGYEIFLYTIQYTLIYEPTSFNPIRRPILRYNKIHKDYWNTQINNGDAVVTETPRPLTGRDQFNTRVLRNINDVSVYPDLLITDDENGDEENTDIKINISTKQLPKFKFKDG